MLATSKRENTNNQSLLSKRQPFAHQYIFLHKSIVHNSNVSRHCVLKIYVNHNYILCGIAEKVT